jgi:hypothetical protein
MPVLVSTMFILASCYANAQRHSLIPPAQSVAPAFVTADSGPKPGVAGKSWSRWYRLGVGKAPSGYTVQKVEFWLTGNHKCGVSAECREVTKTDQQILWEFRLQGRDNPDVNFSEGHIRVTYRPQ